MRLGSNLSHQSRNSKEALKNITLELQEEKKKREELEQEMKNILNGVLYLGVQQFIAFRVQRTDGK